jgi:hypothetical protein
MHLTDREQKLISPFRDDIETFFDNDTSVIIDWREPPEEMLEDFQRFLPPGYFSWRLSPYFSWRNFALPRLLYLRRKLFPIVLPIGRNRFFAGDVVPTGVDYVIKPEFEVHIYFPTALDDTQCYLVRPTRWWRDFQKNYPAKYAKIFLSMDALHDLSVNDLYHRIKALRT